jgi:hypothetical protein
VDEVRREEQKERIELKKSRYVWLKRQENLSKTQKELLENLSLKKLNLKTARAYRIKPAFQEFYKQTETTTEDFLKNGTSGQPTAVCNPSWMQPKLSKDTGWGVPGPPLRRGSGQAFLRGNGVGGGERLWRGVRARGWMAL